VLMNIEKRFATWTTCVLLFVCVQASSAAETAPAAGPRVFLLDVHHLQATRARISKGEATLAPALAQLERDAQAALKAGPFSVVNKTVTPPSGDKHDYLSLAPYFWPNPNTSSGFPYIRRDGERNPDINEIPDHKAMGELIDAVETVALAYYFKGDEKYATKASELLRVWFLDPKTRMNPHLQFAQGIPGVNTGRGIGIIETARLGQLVDAIGLLAGSKAWSQADQRGMEKWCASYLDWLLESQHGREEAAAKNNHGTHYDVQVVSLALFVGRKEVATNTLKAVSQKRIAMQIEPDGRQPLELERTKAWSYSISNLRGLMLLARLGEHVGVDLWNFRTTDGRSIRKAAEYLVPFALRERDWPFQQIDGFSPRAAAFLLYRAAVQYPEIRPRVSQLIRFEPSNRSHLLFAMPPETQQNTASGAAGQ
jgi:hypothetical protein